MSKLTVQAIDSAAAMDEIVSKLGPDAVILSTTKRNGKVVMEASAGSTLSQQNSTAKNKFANIFSDKIINAPGKQLPLIVPEQSTPHVSELNSLRKQMIEFQDMLNGLFITDLNGTNQNLSANSRVILQQAGFSSQILNDFKSSYLGLAYHDGCEAFLTDLTSHLTYTNSEKLLSKKLIFVTGQSGTGRTTLVGKLTAMLKEASPNKEVITVEMRSEGQSEFNRLQDFARLLNSQVYTVGTNTPSSDFKKMKPNEIMVFDLALPIGQAIPKLAEIYQGFDPQDLSVIATIPASTSSNMIELTMNKLKFLDPIVALTKLDECDVTTTEFSSLAAVDAKIGLFSASKSIVDAPIFASESVLMQYLQENLNSEVTNSPFTHKSEN
ncbi:hypothetical protein N8500_07570 [Candidatus Puniceispirillum sp.]|nr:hypothetical protein [Candidatus Puniceispirillum sp.]